ncbi:MAG: amylase [Pseudomonadales bacterium]
MSERTQQPRAFRLAGERKPEQDLYFREALDPSLWRVEATGPWHAYWCTGMPAPAVFAEATHGRSINHIPGNGCLTIKNRLYQTLTTTRERILEQLGPDDAAAARMDFVPRVYGMPQEYHDFQQAALESPDKRWILKPKNSSRGRGIRVVDDAAAVPSGPSWMVQEYLEKPHLMYGHKYVLRLYVLIRSTEPLRVYLYRQGFAKLASEPYRAGDWDNPYVHLTNPDVNATNSEADSPVVFIDFDRYRSWLRDQGHDDHKLFARIRDLVALTAISGREPMRAGTLKAGADPESCYELLGLDCLVDDTLKPWILECNLSPSMGVCAAPKDGGDVEAVVKRQLVTDMVSLLGLNVAAPSPARTTAPAAATAGEIVRYVDAELARAGGFERVYPAADVERYLPFLPLPRLADMILADAAMGARVARPRLRRRGAVEIISDQRLTLYGERCGQTYATNPSAGFVWLKAVGGADPDEVADDLVETLEQAGESSRPHPWTIRNDVWNALADWAETQLLIQHAGPRGAHQGHKVARTRDRAARSFDLQVGSAALRLRLHGAPLIARLGGFLGPLRAPAAASPAVDSPCVEILRALRGFSVVVDGEVCAEHLPLAEVAGWLTGELQRQAIGDGEVGLSGCLVPTEAVDDGHDGPLSAVWFSEDCAGGLNAAALGLGLRLGRGCFGGLRLAGLGSGPAAPIGLPIRIAQRHFHYLESLADRRDLGDAFPCTTGPARDFLVPALGDRSAAAYEVRAVVVSGPAGDRNNSNQALQPVGVNEVMAALLPGCIAAKGRRPGGHAVAALSSWTGHLERYAADVSDADGALAVISALSRRSADWHQSGITGQRTEYTSQRTMDGS